VSEAKLTLEELSRPEQRLPLRKFVSLIEAASRSTGDDCFGAHLGQICELRQLGLPGYLATFASTVEVALASFARYYYLLGDATDVRFDVHGERACFSYCVLDDECWPRRQDAEQVISMIVLLMRQWVGPGWSPERIVFEHGAPVDAAELERVLGCPIAYECDTNSVWFDRASAQGPNPRADERLFQLLSWFAETVTQKIPAREVRASFREQALASIDMCANLGNASIHSVARSLGLEPRTFQRRLRLDHTSFRELCDEYLQRQAEALLRRPELGEKQIAQRLGYGNLTSFIRAFRRWHGVPPGVFRARLGSFD
jgi:AraC-like DNA-binding protein